MGKSKKQPAMKPKDKYTQQQLICAIQDVKNGLTQFAAAKKYNIPRSTLFNKISGKTLIGKKSGPGTVLSNEEESIVEKWMFTLAVRGFPVTKGQLLRSIQLYLNKSGRKTIFTNNYPGRKWFDSFLGRHPKIRQRLSQNLTPSRAAVTADNIRNWHSEIRKYCEDNNLLQALGDPERVFNMDEKGFVLTKKSEVVLVEKGSKVVYSRSKNDEKECVTALLGGSAAGKATPPMVVHSYKRLPGNILNNLPPKWHNGISDSGWQTQQTFFDYMTTAFHPWLLEEKIELPVILFIDGHKSHVSINLSDFCAANKIVLIGLYPNSTHLTQPMDVGVFKSLNSSWEKEAKQWRLEHNFQKIDKKDVAPILNTAINQIKYSDLLKSAFEKSGLFPFNAENINFTRILPNIAACVTSPDELWSTSQPIAESNGCETKTSAVESACSRLKHIESLIGENVLGLFRLSGEFWSGATEYSALFNIWKQMYNEASGATVVLNSNIVILDVECLHNDNQDTGEFILCDEDWFIEGADSGEAVLLEHTSAVSTEHIGDDMDLDSIVREPTVGVSTKQCTNLDEVILLEHTKGACTMQSTSDKQPVPMATVSDELILLEHTMGACTKQRTGDEQPVPMATDSDEGILLEHTSGASTKQYIADDESLDSEEFETHAHDFVDGCNEDKSSIPKATSIDDHSENDNQFVELEGADCMFTGPEKLQNKPGNIAFVSGAIKNFENQPGKDNVNKVVVGTTTNSFNPDAFKSAFFWPSNINKKNNKTPKEKLSSVLSGEAWRNMERQKLEEKRKIEAEKKERKEERDKKKADAVKIAAEKKVLKEKKAREAAIIAAVKETKRLERQEKKRARAQKLTCKVTPAN